MKEDFVFFWGSSSPFSNWYKGQFTYALKNFNCSEQYMMWSKAMLFGDYETAIKVMLTRNPREQKALGRLVNGFDQSIWEMNCIDIMVPALVAKFTQDQTCNDALFATIGKEIVEASPYDIVWGIGLAEDDPRAWDKETWQGRNLLGVCLMKTRDILWP